MVRSIPYLAFKGKCRGEFFGIIHTMKANTATATTVALSVAVLTTLSACARTFDFSAGITTDTVVYAVGQRPQRQAATALYACAPEFYLLGDCVAPANIMSATSAADTIARAI